MNKITINTYLVKGESIVTTVAGSKRDQDCKRYDYFDLIRQETFERPKVAHPKPEKLFYIGEKVKVYNRYLFAVPVIGTVIGIDTSVDGAIQLEFDENQHGNANKRCSGKWFFNEEIRKIP